MSLRRALAFATTTALVAAGCSSEPTGVHVNVHLGGVAYDELRFGVVEAGIDGGDATTLVDPDTLGRKTGPFGPGDQDVVILLDDSIGGREIFCDVAALRAGVLTGTGDNAVLGQTHRIRDVDIFMTGSTPDDGGAAGDAATGGHNGGDDGGDDGGGGLGGGDGGGGSGGGGNGAGGVTGEGGRADAGTDAAAAGGRAGAGGAGAGGGGGAGGAGGATAGSGALGTRCTTNAQCATLHCVDGVCCESACNTACFTCNLNAGQAGRCQLVANRALDPRGICVDTGAASCGTNGTCTGAGQCARYPFGTTCLPACANAQNRFTAGICSLAGTCAGIGTPMACPAPARACAAGRCL